MLTTRIHIEGDTSVLDAQRCRHALSALKPRDRRAHIHARRSRRVEHVDAACLRHFPQRAIDFPLRDRAVRECHAGGKLKPLFEAVMVGQRPEARATVTCLGHSALRRTRTALETNFTHMQRNPIAELQLHICPCNERLDGARITRRQ
jgi:hypothetical protein